MWWICWWVLRCLFTSVLLELRWHTTESCSEISERYPFEQVSFLVFVNETHHYEVNGVRIWKINERYEDPTTGTNIPSSNHRFIQIWALHNITKENHMEIGVTHYSSSLCHATSMCIRAHASLPRVPFHIKPYLRIEMMNDRIKCRAQLIQYVKPGSSFPACSIDVVDDARMSGEKKEVRACDGAVHEVTWAYTRISRSIHTSTRFSSMLRTFIRHTKASDYISNVALDYGYNNSEIHLFCENCRQHSC